MEPPSSSYPPPPPSPFSPTGPAPAPRPSGCGKPVIIGCLVILVLLGIGLVLLVTNAPKLLDWALGQMEATILAQLPPDVTPEEKERLQQAFAGLQEAVDSGKANPAELQDLQRKMMSLSGKNLTREEILELTRDLEEAAGKTSGSESI